TTRAASTRSLGEARSNRSASELVARTFSTGAVPPDGRRSRAAERGGLGNRQATNCEPIVQDGGSDCRTLRFGLLAVGEEADRERLGSFGWSDAIDIKHRMLLLSGCDRFAGSWRVANQTNKSPPLAGGLLAVSGALRRRFGFVFALVPQPGDSQGLKVGP